MASGELPIETNNPSENQWWIAIPKFSHTGPLSLVDVQKRIAHAEANQMTLAWKKGWAKWKPLGECEEFQNSFSSIPGDNS